MKKLFLAFLAVGSIATAQAQKAGSILLYGNAGIAANRDLLDYNSNAGVNDPEVRNLAWSISPGIGFQFNKNWTVGVAVGLVGTKQYIDNDPTSGFDTENRYLQLNVGPFVRYTMPISRTFFAWHQFDLGYMYGNSRFDDNTAGTPDVVNTRNGFYAAMTPGIGINVTKCIALNFNIGGIGYQGFVEDGDSYVGSERRVNAFGVTIGQQFNWGVSANLGGYKHMKGHGEPGMDNRRMNAYDEDDSEDMPKRKKRMNDDDEE